MHADQLHSDADMVRQLLRDQQPQWAELAIARISSTGTDNAIYRLGEEFAVRLPLRPTRHNPFAKEHRWLPELAGSLPLEVPVPFALGTPSETFPWYWSVGPWIDGEDGVTATHDKCESAADLVDFIAALHSVDCTGGPTTDRGGPLNDRDEYTRAAIAASSEWIDTEAVAALWDDYVHVEPYAGPPVWLHADLASGNLLFRNQRLAAVIDFGCLTTGDPAVDLHIAWEMFDAPSRAVLRCKLDIDDATWERSKGWALSTAIIALPYYAATNLFMADQARHKLHVLLNES